MTALAIVRPDRRATRLHRELCREHGIPGPEAIHSKAEASEIIAAMREGRYDPERYRANADLPDTLRPG